MKIRKGFVTNSSSSSFVIGFKSEGLREIEETLDKVPAIFKSSFLIFKKMFDFKSAITSQEELDNYFVSEYGWRDATLKSILEDDSYLQDNYTEMLKYINQGYGVLNISVDYNDETYCELLGSLPKSDSEIILISNDY